MREWLLNQAAGGVVEYDAEAGTFTLPPEQAMIYANDTSPVYCGGYKVAESLWSNVPRFVEDLPDRQRHQLGRGLPRSCDRSTNRYDAN